MSASDKWHTYEKRWMKLRPFLVFLISLGIVIAFFLAGIRYVLNKYVRPVDEADDTPIVIEIPRGSGPSAIASTLYGETEAGRLIRSKTAFKIYIDFSGKRSRLRAGTYTFSKNMSIVEIVNKLTSGDGSISQEVLTIRLTEGMTVRDMALLLELKGAIKSAKDFEELCKTGEGFENFLSAVNTDRDGGERIFELEGFLFPDTYKVYRDSSESKVINMLLTRFNDMVTAEDIERSNELEMSIDQVITLASMIEKEAKTADFAKVSAVFHNRLRQGMPLQSDATIKYVLGVTELYLTQIQLETDSPYSTHKYNGLPIGPICNPGKTAIIAALNPDEQFIEDNYLYFTLKEPESGELVFTKTYEEHIKEVAKYRDLWIDYDAANADNTGNNESD